MFKGRFYFYLLLILIFSFGSAYGGYSVGAEDDKLCLALEEIKVTADKREVSANKVPTSMTVYTQTDIEDSNIRTAEELFSILPNMYLLKAGPAADIASGISIRGVAQHMSGAPAFGFYIDDIYYNEYDSNLIDIERIELLRGPQGTLYGRNTIGGVLNIVTKKPGNETTGKIRFGYGNYNSMDVMASLSGAVVEDKFFVRASGSFSKSDGYMENEFNDDDDVNSPLERDGRILFRYTPTDKTSFDLGFDALRYESDYTDYVLESEIDSSDSHKANVDYKGDSLKEAFGINLRAENKRENFKIVSITSFRDDENKLDHDMDFTPMDGQRQLYQRDYLTISEELRFVSDNENSPFEWLFGLYGFTEEQDHNLVYTLGKAFENPAWGMFAGPYPIKGKTDATGGAVFGELSYKLDNWLKITGGLRYDHEKQDFEYDASGAWGKKGETDETFSALLPKFALSYTGSENYMPYLSVTKGYKSGGFNLQTNQGEKFDPEYTWNYETGIKTNWFDRRLSLNAAVFYINWEDLQVNASNGVDFLTENAGSATSNGIELELSARPLRGLKIKGSFAYTRSEYDDYKVDATQTKPAVDFSDKDVPFVPDYTGNLGMTYRTMNGFFVGADYIHTGRVFMNNENTLKQGSYNLVNAKIGYESDSFEIYLWSNNIFEEKYATAYVDFRENQGGLWARPGNPRTIGVTIGYNF